MGVGDYAFAWKEMFPDSDADGERQGVEVVEDVIDRFIVRI